ncbi:hypothetical protein ONQ60_27605, partial [Salmonella enterica subsp. enterica serovar Virginia]|nr:hypothetical protein [Salmonella enterica subsp. enterica serovar Virginia]
PALIRYSLRLTRRQRSITVLRRKPMEGGVSESGRAIFISVLIVNMLQYSTYSVISPEGCASILWKSADKAPLAAEAMGIIAPRL